MVKIFNRLFLLLLTVLFAYVGTMVIVSAYKSTSPHILIMLLFSGCFMVLLSLTFFFGLIISLLDSKKALLKSGENFK